MSATEFIKLIINVATWVVIAILAFFVLSLLGGIVFIAKTALQTLLSPVFYIFSLFNTKK